MQITVLVICKKVVSTGYISYYCCLLIHANRSMMENVTDGHVIWGIGVHSAIFLSPNWRNLERSTQNTTTLYILSA